MATPRLADTICSADGCARLIGPHGALGYCSMHYKRLRAFGDVTITRVPPRRCAVPGCTRHTRRRTLCKLHRERLERIGRVDLATDAERFWAHVEQAGADECWLWTGATIRGYGHGHHARGRHFYAHRFSYELHHGPIARGQIVRHRCDNPTCVNPRHLEVGTHKDNVHDMIERGRAWWQQPNRSAATP